MYITRNFHSDELEEDYSVVVKDATTEARSQALSHWSDKNGIAIYELKEVIKAEPPELPTTILTVDDVKLLIEEKEKEAKADIDIKEIDYDSIKRNQICL